MPFLKSPEKFQSFIGKETCIQSKMTTITSDYVLRTLIISDNLSCRQYKRTSKKRTPPLFYKRFIYFILLTLKDTEIFPRLLF